MSIGFYWFKEYKIKKMHYETEYERCFCKKYKIIFKDLHSTSFSATNDLIIQSLIKKYENKMIGYICDDFIDNEDYKFDLIEPKEMSKICEKIIKNEVDSEENNYMIERIEWFKELSDEGYYLAFEY